MRPSDRQPPGKNPDDDRQEEDDRRTRGLAGLAITLALLVIGLALVQRLTANAALEDCLLSGRTNCAPIDTATLTR